MGISERETILQISTAIHSEANMNQSEPIWKLIFFPDYILKWIWIQYESNLKSESPILNPKIQY